MRVLVTAASKHGSTAEIAASIGRTLQDFGHDVTVVEPTVPRNLDAFQAVVLGSAVYEGRWLGEARDFIRNHRIALERTPTWLFSSGPIGEPPKPSGEIVDIGSIVGSLHPVDHRVFAGRLVKHELGFGDRAIATALRAPDGDFRPWQAIDAWACEIASQLRVAEAAPPAARIEPAESEPVAV